MHIRKEPFSVLGFEFFALEASRLIGAFTQDVKRSGITRILYRGVYLHEDWRRLVS